MITKTHIYECYKTQFNKMKHITKFESMDAFRSATELAKPNICKAGDEFPCVASPIMGGGGNFIH